MTGTKEPARGAETMPMRVGIDGRELLGHRTGVGRYLAEICREWMRSSRAAINEFIVYTPDGDDAAIALGPPFDVAASHFHHRRVGRRTGTGWEQFDLPAAANRDGLDVFLAPAYSAPLALAPPSVVIMHDVSFLTHPEWFAWREGFRRRWLAQLSVHRAAAVITSSSFSRGEIEWALGVARDRIHVVPPGVRGPGGADGHVPREPLVLYAGSIFNRRHLPTLLRAFAKSRRTAPEARLTIVGDNRTYPRQDLHAEAGVLGMESHVTFRSYVTDDELSALYRRARVFAFLSEYEGFGMTPVEALAAGVPVVVADTPVAREVCRHAALFVPVGDVDATADALAALLADETLRARQAARAATILPSFDWTRAADHALDILAAVRATGR